jgi:hydrogenase maturation protease
VKPHLVIGLGNTLMGDDGVAAHLLEALGADPRLPEGVELYWAGADLLDQADNMAGRARVTLIDAMLDPARAGDLLVFEDDLSGLAPESPSAHQMAAVGAVELLRMLYPALRSVPITLLAVAVDSASVGLELSPALAARMPGLVEEVLRRLGAAW